MVSVVRGCVCFGLGVAVMALGACGQPPPAFVISGADPGGAAAYMAGDASARSDSGTEEPVVASVVVDAEAAVDDLSASDNPPAADSADTWEGTAEDVASVELESTGDDPADGASPVLVGASESLPPAGASESPTIVGGTESAAPVAGSESPANPVGSDDADVAGQLADTNACAEMLGVSVESVKVAGNRARVSLNVSTALLIRVSGNRSQVSINANDPGAVIGGLCFFLSGNRADVDLHLSGVSVEQIAVRERGNQPTMSVTMRADATVDSFLVDQAGNNPLLKIESGGEYGCDDIQVVRHGHQGAIVCH